MSDISHESLDASANLYDFLALFLDHRAQGGVRDLAWYLQRFPGDDASLAREYLALIEAPSNELFAGRYEVLRELGRGGQGVVSLARDTLLGRTVALKTIEAFGRRLDRLRREAEIASSLDHPGICSILEANFGHTPPYVAMRYVEGESLARLLQLRREEGATERSPAEDALPLRPRSAAEVEHVLEMLERVARALHTAHETGIVHRDIKPGNIVISSAGDPVVLDFGLASHDEPDALTITVTGEALGTPAYMSPEQIRGEQHLDRTTDVYALGVTLYECLTLVQPFEGPSRATIESAVLNTSPVRASSLNRALPREIDAVLTVALDRSPRERYATAEHFAEDLRRVRAREPIRASPPGSLRRLTRWVQRNPKAAAVIAALSVLLALVGVLFSRAEELGEQRLVEVLVGEAIENASRRPAYAHAIATEAYRRAPNTQSTNEALMRTLFHHRNTPFRGKTAAFGVEWEGDVAVFANGGDVIVRDTSTWAVTGTIEIGAEVTQLDLSPDGRRVLVGDASGQVTLWDLGTRREIARSTHSRAKVTLLMCRWSSGRVFEGDESGRLITWTLTGDPVVTELYESLGAVSRHSCSNADGTRLATFSSMDSDTTADTLVHVWDTADGRLLHTLEGHTASVRAADFSRCGSWLATAGSDRTARVWDLESGLLVATLDHPGQVHDVSFGKDGQTLATGCDPGDLVVESGESAFVWDWRSSPETPLFPLRQTGGRATYAIRHDMSGDRIATANLSGRAVCWDAATGEELDRYTTSTMLADVQWGPKGKQIAVTGVRWSFVWALDRRPPRVLLGHGGPVLRATFAPQGTRVLTASSDGTARTWDVASGRCETTLVHDDVVRWAEFSPDGTVVLTGCDDGYARLWRGADLVAVLGPHAGGVTLGRFFDDGRVVTASNEGDLRLWDARGTPLRSWSGHVGAIQQIRISPGSNLVASAGSDRSVRLWSCAQDEAVMLSDDWNSERTSLSESRVFDLLFSKDGRSLVTVAQDEHLRRISIPAGEVLFREHQVNFGKIAHLPGGRFVASFKWSGATSLLDDEFTRASGGTWHTSFITHLDVSSRGRVLTTSGDATGFLLRIENDELVPHVRLVGHDDHVTHGAFSPDGNLVVTASLDGTARLWPVDPAVSGLAPIELSDIERADIGLGPAATR